MGECSELIWFNDWAGTLVHIEHGTVTIVTLAVLNELSEGLGESLEINKELLVLL